MFNRPSSTMLPTPSPYRINPGVRFPLSEAYYNSNLQDSNWLWRALR